MEKAGVALYHRVLRRENFEKAAKDLVSLVYAAEKKEPGKPRILYLDIDGHRNAQNGFDVDMLELQKEFGLNFLLPFLTEIHFPMISMRNNNAQRNDVPEQLEIFRARNEKNHSLDDLYVENFSHTEYQLEESVYAYLKWVSDFLKRYHELDVTLLPPEPYDPQNYLLQWRLHMRELINELFNMFVGGNLFSAAAMTRTLMECCVYGKVLKQEKSARLLEDWFLCGMIRGLRGENGALWQAGVKIVYELCSDWIQRKRFAGSKRAMKTSGWLLCSRAKAESASIKFANTYRKRSSIRRINGPAHLPMGRISAPKCIPSRFMIPHIICLR
jgi:hypothetical protein